MSAGRGQSRLTHFTYFWVPAYLRNGGSEAFQICYADYWSCLPHSGRVHGHNVLESVQNKDILTTTTTTCLTALYWWWPGWAGTRKTLTPCIQCLLDLYNQSYLMILSACFFMSTRSLWLSAYVSVIVFFICCHCSFMPRHPFSFLCF